MPFTAAAAAVTVESHGARFTPLAAPSLGAVENAVWVVELAPGTPGMPHRVTREETFVCLAGEASVAMNGSRVHLTPGSAFVVPAHTEFAIETVGDTAFRALVVFPVGGQAIVGDAPPFTPPWAM